MKMVGKGFFYKNINFLSLAAEVISIFIFFLSVRFLILDTSVSAYGTWSFVMGLLVIVRLIDFSGATNLTRMLSSSIFTDYEKFALVDTFSFFVIIFYSIFGGVLYLAISLFFDISSMNLDFGEFSQLFFLGLLVMVSNVLYVSYLSSLDGFQRPLQRCFVAVLCPLIFICSCIVLVPKYGLYGFGFSNFLQFIIGVALARAMLLNNAAGFYFFPSHFSFKNLKKCYLYAVSVEISERPRAIFDPAARVFIGSVFGFEKLAIYDLSFKIMNFSHLAFQSFLRPSFASISQFIPKDVEHAVERTASTLHQFQWFFIFSYFLLVSVSPILSYALFNEYNVNFIKYVCILSFGFSAGSISHFSFLISRAIGDLRVVVTAQLALLVSLFCALLFFNASHSMEMFIYLISFSFGFFGLFEFYFVNKKYEILKTLSSDSLKGLFARLSLMFLLLLSAVAFLTFV